MVIDQYGTKRTNVTDHQEAEAGQGSLEFASPNEAVVSRFHPGLLTPKQRGYLAKSPKVKFSNGGPVDRSAKEWGIMVYLMRAYHYSEGHVAAILFKAQAPHFMDELRMGNHSRLASSLHDAFEKANKQKPLHKIERQWLVAEFVLNGTGDTMK